MWSPNRLVLFALFALACAGHRVLGGSWNYDLRDVDDFLKSDHITLNSVPSICPPNSSLKEGIVTADYCDTSRNTRDSALLRCLCDEEFCRMDQQCIPKASYANVNLEGHRTRDNHHPIGKM